VCRQLAIPRNRWENNINKGENSLHLSNKFMYRKGRKRNQQSYNIDIWDFSVNLTNLFVNAIKIKMQAFGMQNLRFKKWVLMKI